MIISVITPCSRPNELVWLHDQFDKQTWKDKELVVVQGEGSSIGSKRNKACSMASGDVIVMFDSDDYYAPDYLQVVAENIGQYEILGLNKAYFYADRSNAWLYHYRGSDPYVFESGMAFHKSIWQSRKFKDTSSGEGIDFIRGRKIGVMEYMDGFVAMVHADNISSCKEVHKMQRTVPADVERILGFRR